MTKASHADVSSLALRFRKDLIELAEKFRAAESPSDRRGLNQEIERAARELNALVAEIDLVKRPKSVFDPGNPRTIGFFVALALTAQPRKPLEHSEDFYGAGVYSIYYNGNFPLYRSLKNSESPIYVGQAVPGKEDARTPVQQGRRLAARLNEHRKNVERATETLRVKDFEYRALVVQTGWESGAENYLIRLFRPIWNKQMKLVYGFGKHGDSAEVRGNKRSPWDTLHAGRDWAGAKKLVDAKTPERIATEIKEHFRKTRIFSSFDDVLNAFIEDLQQA